MKCDLVVSGFWRERTELLFSSFLCCMFPSCSEIHTCAGQKTRAWRKTGNTWKCVQSHELTAYRWSDDDDVLRAQRTKAGPKKCGRKVCSNQSKTSEAVQTCFRLSLVVHQQDQWIGWHHVVFSHPSLVITLYILAFPASCRSRLRRRVTTGKHQTVGAQSAPQKPSGDPEPSAQNIVRKQGRVSSLRLQFRACRSKKPPEAAGKCMFL